MSSNNNPNQIQIHVNENMKKVYDNQSVLQALLQIDECIQHCCHAFQNHHTNRSNNECAIKIENYIWNRVFKACLAPIEAGMELKTE